MDYFPAHSRVCPYNRQVIFVIELPTMQANGTKSDATKTVSYEMKNKSETKYLNSQKTNCNINMHQAFYILNMATLIVCLTQ